MISDEKYSLNEELLNKDYLKLSVGKKRHIKIQIN